MTMRLVLLLATGGLLALGQIGTASAGEKVEGGFPFPVPYRGLAEGSAPAELARPQSPADGFIRMDGERFRRQDTGKAVRFWGVNLCFGGCFPPHAVADRMARRLATLGVNCVRFHHMDAAGFPRGIWGKEDAWGEFKHEKLHPEALDRLDYLIARLKENGVYTNLNLHVSRDYAPQDGFPKPAEGESVPGYGKGMDIFYPPAIAEQKRYARMLLNRENPYTGNRYAEEPALAFVEINNENGLLHQWAGGGLDNLPREYWSELQRQWNEWLSREYGSTAELRDEWEAGSVEGGGPDLLAGLEGTLETQSGARASAEPNNRKRRRTVRLEVSQPGDADWHVQYWWAPVSIERGAAYVLRFQARAEREAQISANCMMAHEPWQHLGLTRSFRLGPEWREYEFFFVASADDERARVTLSRLSEQGLQISFTRPVLKKAPVHGLSEGEGLQRRNVGLPKKADFGGRTPRVRRDVVRFLRDMELGYWRKMYDFLRNELDLRAAITGTALGFTTPHIMAETMDFVDAHSYWRHPSFPGRAWDMSNWRVAQDAMVRNPSGSTIGGLAGRRVFGLPYTVTEYNHSAPNLYEAEGFPLVGIYGAFQAWDGVFVFAYSHGTDWEKDHFASFFDIKGHPVKLALMPAASHLLRTGAVESTDRAAMGGIPLERRLRDLLPSGPWSVNAYSGGVDGDAWRDALVGVTPDSESPLRASSDSDDGGAPTWNGESGYVELAAERAAGLVGFVAGRTLRAESIRLTPGQTSLDGFSVVVLNPVDGQRIGQPGRYLITAVARARNRDMGWNEPRTTVGNDWGTGPSLCEGVPLEVRVEVPTESVELFPLNPDGSRRTAVESQPHNTDPTRYQVGPGRETLWYELVIGE